MKIILITASTVLFLAGCALAADETRAPAAVESDQLSPIGAEDPELSVPTISEGSLRPAESRQEVATMVRALVILTVVSLAPALLIMVTCFTRVVVVLFILRQGLASQQLLPGQIVVGLALVITFLVMAPVFSQVNEEALKPYVRGEASLEASYAKAAAPIRDFMRRQARPEDVRLFLKVAGFEGIDKVTWGAVPTRVLVPAFVISELKTAFLMGFYIYLPFLVIDLVISGILISMGVMMLPPVLVSLPFKLLLFVLVDGWNLVVKALVTSFVAPG